ncbi:MAG: hypothetical protein ACHQAX_09670 [Gammaproteobacteria bacterium]
MEKVTQVLFGVMLSIFFTSSAIAKNKSEAFIENFAANCVYSAPAFEKMESMAKIANWHPLSKEEAQLLGPVDPGAQFKGWRVQEEKAEDSFFIGYSQGVIEGNHMKNCAITSQNGTRADITRMLTEMNLVGKQLMNDTLGFQTSTVWEAKLNGGYSGVIFFITYKEQAGGVLVLGIIQ